MYVWTDRENLVRRGLCQDGEWLTSCPWLIITSTRIPSVAWFLPNCKKFEKCSLPLCPEKQNDTGASLTDLRHSDL